MTTDFPSSRPSRSTLFLATITFLIPVAVVLKDSPLAFYGSDSGACYLQARLISETSDVIIPVRPALKPVLMEFFPWRFGHIQTGPIQDPTSFHGSLVSLDGETIRLTYPLGFAWGSALLYRLFGDYGLYILPLLSACLIFFGAHRIGIKIGLDHPERAACLSVLATPVGFYTTTLWGHAPAAATFTLALALLVSSRSASSDSPSSQNCFGAGCLLGIGGLCRNESILLGVIVILCYGASRRGDRRLNPLALALGFTLGLSPMICHNLVRFGSIADPLQTGRTRALGSAATIQSDSGQSLTKRVGGLLQSNFLTAREFLVGCDNFNSPTLYGVTVVFGLSLILMWASLISLSRAPPQGEPPGDLPVRISLLGPILVAPIVLLIGWSLSPFQVPGLLLCSPILVSGLAWLISPQAWERKGGTRWIAATILLFFAGCAARGTAQLQWGGRYLIPIQPALLVLSLHALQCLEHRVSRPGRIRRLRNILLGLSLVMTALSYRERPFHSSPGKARGHAILTAHPNPAIVFDYWWFAWCNSPLWFESEFFFLDQPKRFQRLFDHLASVGIQSTTVITRRKGEEFETYRDAALSKGWRLEDRYDDSLPNGDEWHVLFLSSESQEHLNPKNN